MLKVARLAVGVTFGWLLLLLAVETLVRRRRAGRSRDPDRQIESAYRRFPKTRPTTEFRTFRLHHGPSR
jgi:hypothetical protein